MLLFPTCFAAARALSCAIRSAFDPRGKDASYTSAGATLKASQIWESSSRLRGELDARMIVGHSDKMKDY